MNERNISMKTGNRNYGISLLKAVSMLFVLNLHILGGGGILETIKSDMIKSDLVWILETVSFCAVDIFAIITGYLSVNSKGSLGRIPPRWLQAFFYAFVMEVLLHFMFGFPLSGQDLLVVLLPVSGLEWRYFTSYFIVLILEPYINAFLMELGHDGRRQIGVLIFAASAWTTFCLHDPVNLLYGYSFIWIFLLYVLGAIIRLEEIQPCPSKRKAWLILAGVPLLAWLSKCVMERSGIALINAHSNDFIKYTSPFVLLQAVMMLLVFKEISVSRRFQKVVAWAERVSFGVFLIHTQKTFYDNVWNGAFVWAGKYGVLSIWAITILLSFCIFVLCGFIEQARLALFAVLKIDRKSSEIFKSMIDLTGKIIFRFDNKREDKD